MNGYHNGINGHMEELEEGCTFLFTSESVGEGHPGKLFRFTPRPHVSSAIFYTIVREFFLHVHTSKKPFSNIVSSANSVWCHDATGCNEQTFASSLRRRPCKPRAAVTPCEYLPLRDVFTFFFVWKLLDRAKFWRLPILTQRCAIEKGTDSVRFLRRTASVIGKWTRNQFKVRSLLMNRGYGFWFDQTELDEFALILFGH